MEDVYESVSEREIRQVFEGQNRIHLEIKQLNRQLAMILDEQRRYVSVITEEISKRSGQAQSGQVGLSYTLSGVKYIIYSGLKSSVTRDDVCPGSKSGIGHHHDESAGSPAQSQRDKVSVHRQHDSVNT